MARRVRLAGLAELQSGPARLILHPGPAPYRSILLVGPPERPRAYWNVCRHLPVPLDGGMMLAPVEGEDLVCHTHGARYAMLTGYCHEGPCEGESLLEVPIELEDDTVYALVRDDGGPLED